jgi:sec-independent protein translocase protein TatB
MFEFDASKLIIIGIVALIVIGPKELPRVLRQAGQVMAKMRRMAAEFQSQFMDAMREAELTEIKEEAQKLAESTKLDARFDPVAELKGEITRAIDGAGTMASEAPVGAASSAIAARPEAPTENSVLAPDATLESEATGADPARGGEGGAEAPREGHAGIELPPETVPAPPPISRT